MHAIVGSLQTVRIGPIRSEAAEATGEVAVRQSGRAAALIDRRAMPSIKTALFSGGGGPFMAKAMLGRLALSVAADLQGVEATAMLATGLAIKSVGRISPSSAIAAKGQVRDAKVISTTEGGPNVVCTTSGNAVATEIGSAIHVESLLVAAFEIALEEGQTTSAD